MSSGRRGDMGLPGKNGRKGEKGDPNNQGSW